jgi:thiamine-monophosphate kinase
MTEASAGCNLISKSEKVHPIKAQGWNSLKGNQE